MIVPTTMTPAERTLWESRYQAATAAYNALATGQAVVRTIDQNGETVEFNRANLGTLAAYIKAMRDALYPALAAQQHRPPLRFVF